MNGYLHGERDFPVCFDGAVGTWAGTVATGPAQVGYASGALATRPHAQVPTVTPTRTGTPPATRSTVRRAHGLALWLDHVLPRAPVTRHDGLLAE